jgi:DNA repair protein RecN (Recombination protein N)
MLRLLRVKNLAVIESVEVEFREGLNVLTGETGAGKSMLMGALNLLLGARGSSDLVRTGADEAVVEALFDMPEAHAREGWPEGFRESGGELLVSRRLHKSGRSKCFVNGNVATVGMLQALAGSMVTIFGQHEQHVLLNPGEHLEILDRFGGLTEMRKGVSKTHAEWRAALTALDQAKERLDDLEAKRLTNAEYAEELTKAELRADEEEELVRERELVKKSAQVREKAYESYAALYGRSGSVVETCKEVRKALDVLASIHPDFEPYRDELSEISFRLEDIALTLREKAQKAEEDPGRLDLIEERLALIRKLKRKYGRDVRGLLDFLHSLGEEEGDALEARRLVKRMEASAEEAGRAYRTAAEALGERRIKAARALEDALEAELADLAMQGAVFVVRFHEVDHPGGANGLEKVEFLLSANKGEAPKPLARAASGGELSRIMLALKALQVDSEGTGTVVFDEVDAGIGGRTAVAVAERLARVARTRQVICITHLHQIAAKADLHVSVSKSSGERRAAISLTYLEGDERIRELARMLGAAPDSETARYHALGIINAARQEGAG